ncbi:unnamed protein product, partial [Rotaria sp. Silwood1]
MSYYPTGMGAATGNHYHNVAAQMQAYLNNGGGHFQPAQSEFYQYHPNHGFHNGGHHH